MNLVERAVRFYFNAHPYKSIFNDYKFDLDFLRSNTKHFNKEDVDSMFKKIENQCINFPIKIGHIYATENQRVLFIAGTITKEGKKYYRGVVPLEDRATWLAVPISATGECLTNPDYSLVEKLPLADFSAMKLKNFEV